MIFMYDSITASSLPQGATAVSGYVDGNWPSFGAIAERFYPHAHCLSITVHGNVAACCDCETGDLTPGQAEAWVASMLARGIWRPCVYANQSTWESGLGANLAHYGKRIRRWVAAYPGTGVNVPAGYDAHQYTDHGPHGENYDISICRPDFFPEPPPPKPKPSPKPTPKITAAAIAGAFTTALTALLHAKGVAHWKPTPEEMAAITTAATVLAGYLKKG